MKVILIAGSYPPDQCGVGDYTKMLATALSCHDNVSVTVFTNDTDRKYADHSLVVVNPATHSWRLRDGVRLFRMIRNEKPDVIHIQYPTQGYGKQLLPWLLPAIAYCTGASVFQTWHEGFNRRDMIKFLLMAMVPSKIIVVRKEYMRQFQTVFQPVVRWKKPIYINSGAALPQSSISVEHVATLRQKYLAGQQRLISFFGFLHPVKGVEQIFDIANAESDRILIVGGTSGDNQFITDLNDKCRSLEWYGKVNLFGFTAPEKAAEVLKVSDAIVLPLRKGGGVWNTSILAGVQQGTFVLTTSQFPSGYDEETNVYYAKIGDIVEMRTALAQYSGSKRRLSEIDVLFSWPSISARHLDLYRDAIHAKGQRRRKAAVAGY
jgi:glycosyltransferase involved in cell wall biosynthesis